MSWRLGNGPGGYGNGPSGYSNGSGGYGDGPGGFGGSGGRNSRFNDQGAIPSVSNPHRSHIKLKPFNEDDDAKIFLLTFENLTKHMDEFTRANTFLNTLEKGATARIKGDLNCEWTYKNLKIIFISEFMDATEIARAKDRFLSIKIEKNENLEQFAKRYYVLAQDLKFEGSLSLIDAKNAMYQALAPHRFLSAVCTSHIVAATNTKAITNIVKEQAKNFATFGKESFSTNFSSSSSRPAKIMALTSENCERYGDTANYRIRCFLCKEIGHRKVNCPKNKRPDNQASIYVLSKISYLKKGRQTVLITN